MTGAGIPALALFCLSPRAARAQDVSADTVARLDTVPQLDVMDLLGRVLHGRPKPGAAAEEPPKVVLSILPAISASPSVGLLVGVSGNALFRLGPTETTSPSTVSASVNYTTKKQFNVLLRSNLFTSGNDWKFEGDWRYLDTNQPTYGLGSVRPTSAESPMDFNLARIYETVYREISQNVLLGIGFHLNHYFNIVDHDATGGNLTPFLAYNNGRTVTKTTSSGYSFNVITDTRDNPINAKKGVYGRASFKTFPEWMGSTDSWQATEFELRFYPRVSARSNLAFWGITWFAVGKPPYLDLPAIGWDFNNRTGRGYAQGRIRGNGMAYAEAEYRLTLTRNGLLGAAAFINLTSATRDLNDGLEKPNAGFGGGLRIKLNKHSQTNITVDLAFGAEGSGGVFLGTGEAF